MAGAAGEAIDAARENFANDIGKKVATALYELPAGRAKSRRSAALVTVGLRDLVAIAGPYGSNLAYPVRCHS